MSEITFKSDIDVTVVQKLGGDHMVVAAARVSVDGAAAMQYADPQAADEVSGVIGYMVKHRHGTPFEHGTLTLFVRAPIFVWREWHRHRVGFSYNEESARYKKLDPVFYLPAADRPLFKVDGWKPGRPRFLKVGEAGSPDVDLLKAAMLESNLKEAYRRAYDAYELNLGLGVDPGLARACLPVGIYSSCWVTANPRSLMHFLSLRTYDESAKFVSYPLHEIEVAARAVEKIFQAGWPKTHAAFVANGRVAP